MSSNLATYRQPSVEQFVESWFTMLDKPSKRLEQHDLFLKYTRTVVDMGKSGMVLSYSDWARAVYSLGIIDVIDGPLGIQWEQLDNWRPSLDQVKRLKI